MSDRMTNEEKLDAIYRMTLENHEVLRVIRREQFIATLGRIFYWLLILSIIGGTYYYVRPILGMFTGNSSQVETMLQQVTGQLPEARVLNQVIEGIKNQQ